ncbi:MAG: sigma-54 dependent transcriptional regulator [Candidatus Sumerlaeota bacterium]|nr:sigma-54 dependent transcriptional regulator [Candidatus Sumerlaeota bacterium]
MGKVLIIDDDERLGRSLQIQLKALGHEARYATDFAGGRKAMEGWAPDLLLLDLSMPDQSGLEVLTLLRSKRPDLPIVLITGRQDMKAGIEAMRLGAFDYLRKPFAAEDIVALLEKVRRFAAASPEAADGELEPLEPDGPWEIVGADRKIIEVVKQIGLLSRSQVTVLIEGESGTGKELVARALHEASAADRPFVAINCSALVPTLMGSELFGHEKGAFTGADFRKIGKLEHAQDGLVFLDEIGDMPLDLQAKILRVLQEREFERVGGLKSIPFRARVVAATNRDLEAMVREKTFRQDLYFRIAVSRIQMPPLRERKGDVPLLAERLVERIARRLGQPVRGIAPEAIRRLERHDWPGNVRELENVLTRAVVVARGEALTEEDLPFLGDERPAAAAEPGDIGPLRLAEKVHIERALQSTNWNITRTARLLEISPTTLRKKIDDYGIARSS